MNDEFALATTSLAEVLVAENAALTALDLPRAGAMLAAKTRAADAFVAARAVAPNSVASAPRELCALVEENQRLLETAIKVQGRVIGIIAGAVRGALRDPAAMRYGAQGRAAAVRPRALAISARA
jgi:uncharacterized protein YcfJ